MDGQYRKDIASPDTEDPAGFGDRSQKDRGFVQVMSMGGGVKRHKDHAKEHHSRERFYTVDRKDKKSFYDPMAETVAKAASKSGNPTPVYHDPYKWGMAIDLDRCTGCSACAVACYAENNLAVVGEDKFENGQGMHWMRIERYWDEPNLGNERVRDTQEHGASFMPMMPMVEKWFFQ